tara:strand:+ start:500 stop:1510 length:1011 start_codon:yes stop_codon:yes gene_type:complete
MSADKTPGAGAYVPYFIYNKVETTNRRHSSEEYKSLALSSVTDKLTRQIFEQLHSLSGPLTKIIIKPSPEADIVMRSRDCFTFPLHLDQQFHRMIGHVNSIELTNPRVIMIEGAPETVGEIHSLLEKNNEDKRGVILIARNFPEEISATLATNWIKNSLNILPFVYGDTLSTINLSADMCSVTKGELISPHFGDAISVAILDEDKYGTVDRCIWNSRGLNLYKTVDVSTHLAKLSAKARKSDNEELRDLITERMLSLSNDAVEVWIPEQQKYVIEELDALIKLYGAFVTSGAVETPLGYLPESFVHAAQSAAQTLREEILNIGGFLVRAENEMVAR